MGSFRAALSVLIDEGLVMFKNRFSLEQAARFSFNTMLTHWMIFIMYLPMMIISSLCAGIFFRIMFFFGHIGLMLFGMLLLLFLYGLSLIAVGCTKLGLDVLDGKQVDYSYLYKYYYLVPRVFIVEAMPLLLLVASSYYFLTSGQLPFVVIVFLGLVISWFYFQVRFGLARCFIVDKNQSIIEALRSSWYMTEGIVFDMGCYQLLTLVLKRVTVFLSPIVYVADVSVYRQIIK